MEVLELFSAIALLPWAAGRDRIPQFAYTHTMSDPSANELSTRTLERIAAATADVFPRAIAACVFGSAARGEMRPFSDVDLGSGKLHLYSSANPGTSYSAIEAAIREHVVDRQGASWFVYEDLRCDLARHTGSAADPQAT